MIAVFRMLAIGALAALLSGPALAFEQPLEAEFDDDATVAGDLGPTEREHSRLRLRQGGPDCFEPGEGFELLRELLAHHRALPDEGDDRGLDPDHERPWEQGWEVAGEGRDDSDAFTWKERVRNRLQELIASHEPDERDEKGPFGQSWKQQVVSHLHELIDKHEKDKDDLPGKPDKPKPCVDCKDKKDKGDVPEPAAVVLLGLGLAGLALLRRR